MQFCLQSLLLTQVKAAFLKPHLGYYPHCSSDPVNPLADLGPVAEHKTFFNKGPAPPLLTYSSSSILFCGVGKSSMN